MNWEDGFVGKKFHDLTVLNYVSGRYKSTSNWRCLCDCGNYTITQRHRLERGNTKSCGHRKNIKHRMSSTPEYRAWIEIKRRCYTKHRIGYENYGGRGIKVCDKWLNSFEEFYKDMGPRPGEKYSIERINNDGDYCPENCKWATTKEQSANKRTNVNLTYNGVTRTAAEWAKELGCKCRHTILKRLETGWSLERALTTRKMR